MKKSLFILMFLLSNLIYSQYTQNIPWQSFVGHNNGGGNPTLVTITSTTISFQFIGGFSPTEIQNKYVATLNYTGNLPDMTLGPFPNTSYKLIILSKKVYIISNVNESVTSLSSVSSSLTAFTPISSTDMNGVNATTENFVREVVYLSAFGESGQKIVSTTFYDGLGKPKQQIAHNLSSSGKNIVTPIVYDAFGRQTKNYLPYVSQNTGLDFENNALSDVANYYNTPSYQNTLNPYSEQLLEASPLGRVMKQSAPGNDWLMGGGKEIKFDYQFNTLYEVKLYTAQASWNATNAVYDISLTQSGTTTYPQNTLYKTVLKDENWISNAINNNTTIEFKDKEGKLILKRAFNNGDPYDTYYVYDQFDNLTYVIPPAVTDVPTINQLNGLCYQYKYDYRNRLVEKKLPGKQWEFIVYDKVNRIVATGPVFSPFSNNSNEIGWMITKYDLFNRPLYTGWNQSTTIDSTTRNSFQNNQNALTSINETKTTSGTIDGVSVYYSNLITPTGIKLLTVDYYDDYNFPGAPTAFPNVENQTVYYNATLKPKGLLTGTWVRVPEQTSSTVKAETSYTLYDDKARPIRNFASNYLGGYTQVDSKIDFSGKTLYTITYHKRTSSVVPEIVIRDDYSYSAQEKLVTHTQTINNQTQLLAKNEYNELGQLITKRVGGIDTSGVNALQKVDYSYNVRGWLTDINNIEELSQDADPLDLFAFKINYNITQTAQALYNGNVSETLWKSSSDDILRKYAYSYDNLNRLVNAEYQKPNSANPTPHSYDEIIDYDKNGNITYLFRNGNLDSDTDYIPSENIDQLNYVYNTDSNQLKKVIDQSANPNGFKDDANNATDDYSYDLNGNLTKDLNKGITGGKGAAITYNHLNLPTKIIFGTSGAIEYLYNALGQKVQKKVVDAGIVTTTDYLNGFQYKNTVLQFFPTSEGYVNVTTDNAGVLVYNYVYNYTDHLGNIRLSYSKDPSTQVLKIIEENHYYPFGLKHTNYNSDQKMYSKDDVDGIVKIKPVGPFILPSFSYKFNSQEWQSDLGLNITAMDYRQYDNAIGRFNGIDLLAELNPSITPNHFGNNNPVYWSDPSGLISQDFLNTIFNNSNHGDQWLNDGFGNFELKGGNKGVNKEGELYEIRESLPQVTVPYKGFNLDKLVDIAELQAYKYGKGYQFLRDRYRRRQLDGLQRDLDWAGTIPILGEPIDFINAGISFIRGNYDDAALGVVAMLPIVGWAGTALKMGKRTDNILKTAYKESSGTTKAVGNGVPDSAYNYLTPDGQQISKHFYNDAGKVEFEINYKAHNMGGVHGHNMSIPGSINSGHLPENHVPFMLIPRKYF